MQNGRAIGLNQGLDLAKHLVRCANQTRELSQLGFFRIGGDGRVNEMDTTFLKFFLQRGRRLGTRRCRIDDDLSCA